MQNYIDAEELRAHPHHSFQCEGSVIHQLKHLQLVQVGACVETRHTLHALQNHFAHNLYLSKHVVHPYAESVSLGFVFRQRS